MLGFEQCLSDALFQGPQQLQEGSPGGGSGEPSGDPLGAQRAALALRLLHLASAQPAPNLAHLLLGFDVSSGPKGRLMTRCFCHVGVMSADMLGHVGVSQALLLLLLLLLLRRCISRGCCGF